MEGVIGLEHTRHLTSPTRIAITLAVSRGFSALGGQIALTILPVIVYLISHSLAQAGLVLGARLLISTISTPISGVFADRMNQKTLMLASNSARIALFALMAQLHSIPMLAILIAITAVGGMLEATSVASLTPKIVRAAELPRANAILSSALNLAFIGGPLLSGVIVARFSANWGFYAAALTQVVALLATMTLPSHPRDETVSTQTKNVTSQLFEGLTFAFRDRFLTLMLTVYSVFILGLTAFNVLSVGLSYRFHMGGYGYGILIAAQGAGMLVVTFLSAKWIKTSSIVPLFLINMPIQGLSILAIALSKSFLLCVLFAFFQGVGWGMEQASVMTVLQLRIPSALQGRTIGLFFSALSIAETVGVILFGWLGGQIGDAVALATAGLLSTVFAILAIFLLRPHLRDAHADAAH